MRKHTSRLVSRRQVLQLGAGLALTGLTAPIVTRAQSSPAAPSPGELVRLRDTASGDVSYANLHVAVESGIYQKHGLDASLQLFDIGFLGAEAMLAGEADKANIASLPIIGFLDQGADIVITAVINRSDNIKVLVRSDIAAPADLSGRRIGLVTGGIAEYVFGVYLDLVGVDPASLTIVNVPVSEQVAALVRGDIEGFVWNEPNLSRAREILGDQVALLEPNIEAAVSVNTFAIHTREWAEANRPAVENTLRAMIEANAFVRDNPTEAAAIVAPQIGLEAAELPAQWEAGNFSWEVVFDDIALMDLEAAAQWRVETGVIAEPPDVRAAIDLSYLQAVDPSRVTLTL